MGEPDNARLAEAYLEALMTERRLAPRRRLARPTSRKTGGATNSPPGSRCMLIRWTAPLRTSPPGEPAWLFGAAVAAAEATFDVRCATGYSGPEVAGA